MSLSLPTPIRALIDAANAGDREAFLNCFTPQGVVDDWGRRFTGHSAIGDWSDNEFIGQGVTLDVHDTSPTADALAVSALVGGSGFNGQSTFTFTTTSEHISLMTITA